MHQPLPKGSAMFAEPLRHKAAASPCCQPLSGPDTMSEKTYIYLVLSEDGPDAGRILTSPQPPGDLAERYEADHPGWYVKTVWSVARAEAAASAIAAIKAAYPHRTFA